MLPWRDVGALSASLSAAIYVLAGSKIVGSNYINIPLVRQISRDAHNAAAAEMKASIMLAVWAVKRECVLFCSCCCCCCACVVSVQGVSVLSRLMLYSSNIAGGGGVVCFVSHCCSLYGLAAPRSPTEPIKAARDSGEMSSLSKQSSRCIGVQQCAC